MLRGELGVGMSVCQNQNGSHDSTVQNLMVWSPDTASSGSLECQEREETAGRSEDMGTLGGERERERSEARRGG